MANKEDNELESIADVLFSGFTEEEIKQIREELNGAVQQELDFEDEQEEG